MKTEEQVQAAELLDVAANIGFDLVMENYPHKDELAPNVLALAHGFYVYGYKLGAWDAAQAFKIVMEEMK
jgi:hypothetical protein